jgi:hypothetical protein
MDQGIFEAEVDRNFEAFEAILGSILPVRRGEFVLMRHGGIVSYFPSESDALAEGRHRFEDGVFSVQEVTDRPVDLGFFSHAINSRIA